MQPEAAPVWQRSWLIVWALPSAMASWTSCLVTLKQRQMIESPSQQVLQPTDDVVLATVEVVQFPTATTFEFPEKSRDSAAPEGRSSRAEVTMRAGFAANVAVGLRSGGKIELKI